MHMIITGIELPKHVIPPENIGGSESSSVSVPCEVSQPLFSGVNESNAFKKCGGVICVWRHHETICCFSKFTVLSKSATLTNLKRSEGDDLCVLRPWGNKLLTVLHPVWKTRLQSHLLGRLHRSLMTLGGSVFHGMCDIKVGTKMSEGLKQGGTLQILTSFRVCLEGDGSITGQDGAGVIKELLCDTDDGHSSLNRFCRQIKHWG